MQVNNPKHWLPTADWDFYHWLSTCCWSLLYSAILHSWADSLCSQVIRHEWLAFYGAFLNIHHQSGVLTALFDCYMAGATWNCCHLCAFCIHHTTMHHVMSLHANPHTQGACVSSCNLHISSTRWDQPLKMECGCPSSRGIENGPIHFLKNRCTSSIQRGIWHAAVSITNWSGTPWSQCADACMVEHTVCVCIYIYIYIYMQENCGAHTKSHLALGERSGLRGGMKTKNNIRSTLCGPGSDQLPSVLLLLGLPTASSTWNVKLQVIFDTAKGRGDGGGGNK